MTKFVCVTSGKRGVGKTTTSINLAAALHNMGEDVLLVDGDLLNPKVHKQFGNNESSISLYDALEDNSELYKIIHKHKSGLKIIPTNVTLNRAKNLDLDKFKNSLTKLTKQASTIIIDTSSSLEEEAIAVIEASDEVLVVTNPINESMPGTLNIIKKLEEMKKTVLGVVVNQNRKLREQSDHEISLFLETPIISSISFDKNFEKSREQFHPIVHSHPKSKASKDFNNLALKLQ